MLEWVQHLEAKMEDWQLRFPVRSLGDEVEDIQSSIEQAEFEQFKRGDQRRMWELRNPITDLEARANLLRPRTPMDTWEVVSDRVASETSRVSENSKRESDRS